MARQIRLDLRGTAGRLPSGRRHTERRLLARWRRL